MRSSILLFLLACAFPFAAHAQILPIGTIGNQNNNSYTYPNPFDNVLNVALPTQQTPMCRFEFVNSLGQVAYNQMVPWTSIVTINTSILPYGTYTFNFYTDTQQLVLKQNLLKRRNTHRR